MSAPKNRNEAILEALRKAGKPLDVESLCQEADLLRPNKEGPFGYKKTIMYLGKKGTYGFSVKEESGIKMVALNQWIPDVETEEEPTPTPTLPDTSQVLLEDSISIAPNGLPVIEPDIPGFTTYMNRVPPFIDWYNCTRWLTAQAEANTPAIVEGWHGEGKTLGVFAFGKAHRYPIVPVACTAKTKPHDLIGSQTVLGNEVVFLLGALPQAIVLANKAGTAILLLDELRKLKPDTQGELNPILDFRRSVTIHKLKKTYQLNKGCQIIVVATQNPASYAGTYELNTELLSRFSLKKIDYPNAAQQLEILQLENGDDHFDIEFLEQIISLSNASRASVKSKGKGFAISSRDMHQFLRVHRAYEKTFTMKGALREALENSFYNKMDDLKQREWFREEIRSTLDVVIEQA